MLFGKRRHALGIVEAAGLPVRSREATEVVEMLILGARSHATYFREVAEAPDDLELVTMAACSTVNNKTAIGRLGRTLRISFDEAQEKLFALQIVAERAYISARPFGRLASPPWRIGAGFNSSDADASEPVVSTVRIAGTLGNRIERWVIGEDLTRDQFDKFRVDGTADLYALRSFQGGEERTSLVTKPIWAEARARLADL